MGTAFLSSSVSHLMMEVAGALELIIKGSLDQRKDGKISDDAILAAKQRFGILV
jgi:hypothetical protein